jgi:low temperature requirement protein LtrA
VQLLVIGLMFASLLMSVAIAEAFGGRAWLFVVSYLLLQVGRAVFLSMALRGRALGEHFVNVLIWELLAGCLWVAGAITDGIARLMLWGLAVVVAYGGGSSTCCLAVANRSWGNRHRGRASHRALPAVLPHCAGRERADRRQRIYR